jgi:hypothetical protein
MGRPSGAFSGCALTFSFLFFLFLHLVKLVHRGQATTKHLLPLGLEKALLFAKTKNLRHRLLLLSLKTLTLSQDGRNVILGRTSDVAFRAPTDALGAALRVLLEHDAVTIVALAERATRHAITHELNQAG